MLTKSHRLVLRRALCGSNVAILVKAGNKDEGVMFLLTDSQITNERFLIYINDLLASGNIPDLFAVDEVDTIVSGGPYTFNVDSYNTLLVSSSDTCVCVSNRCNHLSFCLTVYPRCRCLQHFGL